MKNRPLECAKGKALRWAVFTGKEGHLLALFMFEQHARNFAAGSDVKVVDLQRK